MIATRNLTETGFEADSISSAPNAAGDRLWGTVALTASFVLAAAACGSPATSTQTATSWRENTPTPTIAPTPTPDIALLREKICLDNQFIGFWVASAEQWKNYHGPLYIYVPDEDASGPTKWSVEDKGRIDTAINESLEVIKKVFGEEPAWTYNQVVVVVDNFQEITINSNISVYFIDGDLFFPFIKDVCPLSVTKNIPKINLLACPRDKLADKPGYQLAYEFGHELSHAYTQYPNWFPKIWKEGIANMVMILVNYDQSQTNPDAKAYYDEMTKSLIPYEEYKSNLDKQGIFIPDMDILLSLNYKQINDQYPDAAQYIDNNAGFLFKQWYEAHPDFFISLRIKENEFYRLNGRLPNKEEWFALAGADFTKFLTGDPILQIKN